MKTGKIRIACLPVAGPEDPTQMLMMEALNKDENIQAFSGVNDRFFGIIRTAIKYKPDYIHFDWIESFYYRKYLLFTLLHIPVFFLQVWFAAFILRIRVAWTLHNIYPHDSKNRALKALVQKMFARSCKFIRLMSPLSEIPASKALDVSKKKFRIVPGGDYKNYYQQETGKKDARRVLNLDPEKKIILHPGSIKRYKNAIRLIKAFKALRPPDTILLIVGKSYDSAYFNELEKQIIPGITVVEKFIPAHELHFYYCAADIVALPFTEIENSGTILISMGFRKPVVAPVSNVVSFRLTEQVELLYTDDKLEEKLELALNLNESQLKDIGDRNHAALQKYPWTELGELFTTDKNSSA